MLVDIFGTAHTTDNPDALLAFEQVVSAVAAHRPIGTALQETLERDEGLVAAHALAGIASVILGRSETIADAKRLLPAVETALVNRDGGTASERALVDALRLATRGQLRDGANRLDRHIRDCPRDFLCIKISHALRFMSGQSSEMLALTRSVLPAWGRNDRAYGFLLGCHAFGLEERGLFTEAERAGRSAYRHEPADAWGLHAVSHVMEMEHRLDEGIDWLEASRSDWRLCNNFSFHLAWHLALFLLEQGRLDEVLDLYDREIRPEPTDDFRDVANASSILWRVEREGISVGMRWSELFEIAARRKNDVTYIFASLHYLLALVASGDYASAQEMLTKFSDIAANPTSDQARIAGEVGVPLAEVIISMSQGNKPASDLVTAAVRLPSIGGSHAQRDVFLRTLLETAATCGDTRAFATLSRIRHNLRSADRFVVALDKRLSIRVASSNLAYGPVAS